MIGAAEAWTNRQLEVADDERDRQEASQIVARLRDLAKTNRFSRYGKDFKDAANALEAALQS
jgi:hypothetical protein